MTRLSFLDRVEIMGRNTEETLQKTPPSVIRRPGKTPHKERSVRPNYNRQQDPETLAAEIGKGIDDATNALRWCRQHMQERRASETLRIAQLNIAYIALALDWQMEGQMEKAFNAIDHIWWQPHLADEATA